MALDMPYARLSHQMDVIFAYAVICVLLRNLCSGVCHKVDGDRVYAVHLATCKQSLTAHVSALWSALRNSRKTLTLALVESSLIILGLWGKFQAID